MRATIKFYIIVIYLILMFLLYDNIELTILTGLFILMLLNLMNEVED